MRDGEVADGVEKLQGMDEVGLRQSVAPVFGHKDYQIFTAGLWKVRQVRPLKQTNRRADR